MNERGWDGLYQVAYGDGFDQGHKKGYESGHARGSAATEKKIVAWLRRRSAGLYGANQTFHASIYALAAYSIERGEHEAAVPARNKGDGE